MIRIFKFRNNKYVTFHFLDDIIYRIFNRDGFNADAVQNGGSKLIGKSSVHTEATKGEPVLLRSKKNARLGFHI